MSTLAPAEALRADATTISVVGFAHGTSHFFHLMIPPLFPFFMTEFGLGYASVGTLMTVFFVVSGIGQAVAGIWVDRFGSYRVLLAGIALLALSGVLVALAPNFAGLMFAAFVAGCGNSVFHPADFAVINRRVSPPRLGHAFSVHGLSGNLGWALAPLVMVGVAASAGWRAAGWVAAGFGAISWLLLVWQRETLKYELAHEAATGRQALPPVAFGVILRAPLVWIAFTFFFFATFGFGALQNFAPSLLRDVFDLSLAAATSALSIYLVGGACGLLVGGFLAKPGARFEGTVTAAFGASALIALMLAALPVPAWGVLPAMAAMGFLAGLAGPSRDLLVRTATKARLGESAFGRVYGMVYSGLDVGLAIAPIVFGLLMDWQMQRWVFVGFALSFVGAIAAARMLAGQVAGPSMGKP
ncbi:MAG: MFS transporter [Betaproteobacteria bacterium]|nr:MFS transporter [Betaproteobacteria bacterium]